MTPKQKFMQAFLKAVYGFSYVEFQTSYEGCMRVLGTYVIECEVPPRCILVGAGSIRREEVRINIWIDKLKTGGYSIKFKTLYDHIPADQFETILSRVKTVWSTAKADIYYRTGVYDWHHEIPTLRLVVSKLPWR